MLSRYLKAFLLLALATGLLTGCNGVPPQIQQITVQPNKVEVSQSASLAVAASGGGSLKFKWEAQRGAISNSAGSSATYTAPATGGSDIITVTVTNSDGSTTKSEPIEVISKGPQIIEIDPRLFIQDRKDPRELNADIRGGLPNLSPQAGQEGLDLRGYKLQLSLQGDPKVLKQIQPLFKDCKYRNSYRLELNVPPATLTDLEYDPDVHPKVQGADQIDEEGFRHICIVGVKVLEGRGGIRLMSAKLVKVR